MSLGTPTGDPGKDLTIATKALEAQAQLLADVAERLVRGTKRNLGRIPLAAAAEVIACPVRRLEVPAGMEQADVPTVDLTLGCITLGPVGFAGVSGEVTVPVGQRVIAGSPLATTLVISNANARIGYLPTDESYDRKTHASEGCPIVKGHAEAAIVEGMTRLITESIYGRQE
jgi:hypothetical protein